MFVALAATSAFPYTPDPVRHEGEGLQELLLPTGHAREPAAVPGVAALALGRLSEAIEWRAGGRTIEPAPPHAAPPQAEPEGNDVDLSEVRGQAHTKRALEVAAGGGHNILMFGSITNREDICS